MDQVKCPKCGAMNDPLSNFCHSCFAIMAPTGGSDPTAGDAGYASGRITPSPAAPATPGAVPNPILGSVDPANAGGTPYAPFPVAPSSVQPSQPPMAWQPSAPSTRRRRAAWPAGIAVLVFVVIRLFASGMFSSSMFSSNSEPVQPSFSQPAPGTAFSGPLPNSAGGYSKLASGSGAKVADTYSSKTDPSGTGAMYAKGSKPAFLVATLPSLAGYPPADLLGVVTSSLDNKQSAGSAIGTTTTTKSGAATIACAPIVAVGSPIATVCAMSGPATAVVFANAADAKTTMAFTAALSKSI